MIDAPGYQRFFAELKRRRVFRVMAVYGIVGFVILQIVDLAVPALLLPEWTYRLVSLLLLLGFPVAIVLAWAFEMTPEGVKRAADAAPGELREIISAPASTRWPAGLLALVGMIALLAGAWYAGTRTAPAESAESPTTVTEASIAVLPFADMSPDGDQEYFSDGISEELLNVLARIPELQVAARTSSFSYKGKDVKVADVGRELGVGHVLEGSVRKAGNEVRVTAQLIKADDGFHVWSETWDRPLDDIFAIQDEIAADVVAQLKIALLGEVPAIEATDPEAYALYLQGRQLSRQGSTGAWLQASALYEQALEIDSSYAAAWTGLAATHRRLGQAGVVPFQEGLERARQAANRALEIDPEYAPAYAALSRLHYDDYPVAARYLGRALTLDPTNLDVIFEAASMAQSLGRLEESITLGEYVVARDPVNGGAYHNLGIAYLYAGRPDEAIGAIRTALSLDPGRFGTNHNLGAALLLKSEPEAALAAFTEEVDEEYRVKGTAMALHDLGRREEYEAAFRELRERWGERWPSEIAHVYAWTGDADAAFEWLGKAEAQSEEGLTSQFLRPFYTPVHDDPRWQTFRERTGTSEEQLAAIEFEVTLPR